MQAKLSDWHWKLQQLTSSAHGMTMDLVFVVAVHFTNIFTQARLQMSFGNCSV